MAQLNDLIVTGSSRFLNEINGKIDWSNINNKPTIPTVNNATLTIQKNGTNVQTFTANQSTNATANITVPTKVSELTNDSGYTKNTGTVTSVKISATSPIAIDSSAAITTSGERTISHANSGVTAGTYRSVTVNATGHVTAGTNPTTLSGYGITDAKIASGTITLGSNTITPLTSSSTLNAAKLSGTIPSGCYTDTNNAVTQTATDTGSSSYEILFSGTADNTTRTEGARKSSNLCYVPSESSLSVSGLIDTTTWGTAELNRTGIMYSRGNYTLGFSHSDINLSGTDNTWDGTNTSLKSSISAVKTTADNALPLAGGTMTGTIVTPAYDTKGIEPETNNYGQVGSSSKKFYRMYASTFYGDLDGKVKQSATSTSTNNNYAILFSGSTTTTSGKYDIYRQAGLTYNPSTNVINLNNDGYMHFRTGSDDSSGYVDIGSGGIGGSNSDGTGIVISRSDNNGDVLLSGTNNTWDGTNISLKAGIELINSHFEFAKIWCPGGTTVQYNNNTLLSTVSSEIGGSTCFESGQKSIIIKKTGNYLILAAEKYTTVATAGKLAQFGLWDKTRATPGPVDNGFATGLAQAYQELTSCTIRQFSANTELGIFSYTSNISLKVGHCEVLIIPLTI